MTGLDHVILLGSCKSIVDASPRTVLLNLGRQPGEKAENGQPRSEQNEEPNHDQRGEDEGAERNSNVDRRIMLRSHLLW